MDKIVIYSRPDLEAMVRAATFGKTKAPWLADLRTKISAMVKDRPAAYRTFGPYWWPVKAQLVAAGLMAGDVNLVALQEVTSGDDALDMAGAIAYHGFNVDEMRDDGVFTVDTESGDQIDYVLADEDMDALIRMRLTTPQR